MFENKPICKHNSPRNEEVYFKNLMFHKQQSAFNIPDMLKRINTCPDQEEDKVCDSEQKRNIRLLFSQEKHKGKPQESQAEDYQLKPKNKKQSEKTNNTINEYLCRSVEKEERLMNRQKSVEDEARTRKSKDYVNNNSQIISRLISKKEKTLTETLMNQNFPVKAKVKSQENEYSSNSYRYQVSPRAKIIQPYQSGFSKIEERSASVERDNNYIFPNGKEIQSPNPTENRNPYGGSFLQENSGETQINFENKISTTKNQTPKNTRFFNTNNYSQMAKPNGNLNPPAAKFNSPEPCEPAMGKKAPLSAAHARSSPCVQKYKLEQTNRLLGSASKRGNIKNQEVMIINEKVTNREKDLEQRKMKQAELPANIKILAPKNSNIFSTEAKGKKMEKNLGNQMVPPQTSFHPRKTSISSVARNLYEERFYDSQKEGEESNAFLPPGKYSGYYNIETEAETSQKNTEKHFIMKNYSQLKINQSISPQIKYGLASDCNYTQGDMSAFQSDESVNHWNSVIKKANNTTLQYSRDHMKPPCPSARRKNKANNTIPMSKIAEQGSMDVFSKTLGSSKGSNYTQDKIYEYILNS